MQRILALFAIVVFAALHQDFWLWDDARLVFGFLPSGLAYHVAYSVATAGVWLLIVRYVWPAWLDETRDSRKGTGERAQ